MQTTYKKVKKFTKKTKNETNILTHYEFGK